MALCGIYQYVHEHVNVREHVNLDQFNQHYVIEHIVYNDEFKLVFVQYVDHFTMKLITNGTDQTIDIGFDGYTYKILPKSKVTAEEKAAEFLQETYPWLTVEGVPAVKGPSPIPQIEKKKTVGFVSAKRPAEDMQVTQSGEFNTTSVDGLPGDKTMDRDGVEWTGDGIQQDDMMVSSGAFH